MGSYAGQLTPGDRWRVAMYVMNAFKGGGGAVAAPATAVAGTDAAATAAKTDSTATN